MKPMQLKAVDECVLSVTSPFNFRYTFWKPSHFATGLEAHSETTSWRTFRFGKVLCGVRAEAPSSDTVAITAYASRGWNAALRTRLLDRLRIAYGLDEDITPFLRLARRHAYMRAPLRTLAGMRMSCPESIFEIAIVSLLLQNATIARSTQMMSNLLSTYGRRVTFDGRTLWSFFSPEDVVDAPEAELRSVCRLGYRAKYVRGFASFFLTHDDDALRRSPASSMIDELRTIKGVGPYTAGIVASHALRDPSAVALDVWNRRILGSAVLGNEKASPNDLLASLDEAFGSYRGLAALYLVEHEYVRKPMVPLEP